MDAVLLIAECRKLHAVLIPEGDKLRVRAPEPLPADLMDDLRQHKSEVMALLMPRPKEWHAEHIAQAVEQEGICLFWSELFGEMVAFIKDGSYRGSLPADVVAYTSGELAALFGDEASPKALRLIHEAKRAGGGNITGYCPEEK